VVTFQRRQRLKKRVKSSGVLCKSAEGGKRLARVGVNGQGRTKSTREGGKAPKKIILKSMHSLTLET